MALKDKLNIIKESIFSCIPTEKSLPVTMDAGVLAKLDEIDTELDSLLEEESDVSIVKTKVSYVKGVIRIIILLDISGSMRGTEDDIYLGLTDLINKHKEDNILINFIAFNDDRYELLSDVHISNAEVVKIDPLGGTNLNGTLYYALKEKCAAGTNLLVTISDGADTEDKVKTKVVRETLLSLNQANNHCFFLGEPNEFQTPEDVHKRASDLGFSDERIAVFTREGNGNKLNFAVISKMLDDLIEYGEISASWAEPIKEHYLKLTDKRAK